MSIENYGLLWSYRRGMWGRHKRGPTIDLSSQLGIYLIYDRGEVVYVGKSAEGETAGVYGRLIGHEQNGWVFETYSWFGFHPVANDILIDRAAASMPTARAIANMEALLIYLLNPAWNGNGGSYRRIPRYRQMDRPATNTSS